MALITALSTGDEALIPPLLADAVAKVPSETIEVLLGCVDALLTGLTEELDIPKAEIVQRLGLTMASDDGELGDARELLSDLGDLDIGELRLGDMGDLGDLGDAFGDDDGL